MMLEHAYAECAAVTEARAGNFKHAFVFLGAERKRAIEAVYAFSRRADDIADGPSPVEEKREALGRLRASLHEPPFDDPVFVALADTIERFRIPLKPFDELIDGVVQDLDVARYETFDELSPYCYRVASTIGLICLEVFGYEGEGAHACAVDLGIAMQLTNIIRDVREDADRGRVYIPQEEIRRFGMTADLLRFEIARAREYFGRGLKLLDYLPRLSRSCPAILAAIYGRLLDVIEDDPERVLRERVGLPPDEKKRIAIGAMMKSLL